MRIGLDFDGTLADVARAKQRYVAETWGIDLTLADTGRAGALPVLGDERYAEMIHAVHQTERVLETPPLPGALEVTGRLLAAHEVAVITARLDEELELACAWLRGHGLGDLEVVHTRREPKRAVWDALGTEVHLDDTPAVLRDHGEAMVPALIHAPYNAALERCDATLTVEDWLAFERLVARLAEGWSAEGGSEVAQRASR